MSAPKDPKGILAARFLDSLLSEIVIDTALYSHATVKKPRSTCKVCGTRCQLHTPAAAHTHPSAPLEEGERAIESGTPTSSNGIKPDYYSHNPLFECLVCSRQVSSNRYATHLAKCMGGKGVRKGAARTAKSGGTPISSRATPEEWRKKSEYYNRMSEGETDEEAEANGTGKGKRALSPPSASQVATAHINKKLKTSSPTPPPSTPPPADMIRSHSAQTFAPSGLSSVVIPGSPLNPKRLETVSTPSKSRPEESEDDDDSDDDDDDDDSDDDSDDDDDDEEDDDEEEGEIADNKVQRAVVVSDDEGRANSPEVPLKGKPKAGAGLQRERGSDGEFIDVESASEQSDDGLF